MSRNKFVLLIILLCAAYMLLPDDGAFATIKANFVAVLPYVMAGIIIYLIITLNVLKRAWKKLDADINDENVINFAKILNISFDVKRMLGPENLMNLYAKVNGSARASLKAKELLYEALRRKRLDVPPPGKGGKNSVMRKPAKSDAEAKAERIAAAAQARKRKNKK